MLRSTSKSSTGRSFSGVVLLTIYRKPNYPTTPRSRATTIAKSSTSSKSTSSIFKSLLSLLSVPKRAMTTTTVPESAQPSILITDSQTSASNKCQTVQEEEECATTTIDYGYYSIPSSSTTSRSSTTSVSAPSAVSSSSSTSSSTTSSVVRPSELEYECELFCDKSLEMIQTYVRPSRAILDTRQFEELFINYEKFQPMSRHLLALIRSGDLYNQPHKVNLILYSIIFDIGIQF